MRDRFFQQLIQHFDILALLVVCIFTAGVIYSTMSSSIAGVDSRVTDVDARVTNLEKSKQKERETAVWMGSNIVILMRHLKIKPLPKPDDE